MILVFKGNNTIGVPPSPREISTDLSVISQHNYWKEISRCSRLVGPQPITPTNPADFWARGINFSSHKPTGLVHGSQELTISVNSSGCCPVSVQRATKPINFALQPRKVSVACTRKRKPRLGFIRTRNAANTLSSGHITLDIYPYSHIEPAKATYFFGRVLGIQITHCSPLSVQSIRC
jgi:hypothetical protein